MKLAVDFVEGARIAVASLRAHRLRTLLTTVGVGIGVATLLAIVGIIQGLNSSFDSPETAWQATQPPRPKNTRAPRFSESLNALVLPRA